MATTDTVIKIKEKLASITVTPIEELISNVDWGTINFQVAKTDLEMLFNLCNHLKFLPVELVPEAVADTFVTSLDQAMTAIESIKSFNIENVGIPADARDAIVQKIKVHAENLLITTQGWIAFLAYQKGDVQKNLNDLTNAVIKANGLLANNEGFIKEKKVEIDAIVTKTREASASAGVGVFTSDFDGQASHLATQANKWLCYTVISAVLTLAIAFLSIYIPIEKDATNAQIFQFISSKLVIFIVLLTATAWCGRIYKALSHQISVAKHRANGLKTFQAFVNATANDSIKDAVLLETTRSIFANSPSGYLDSTDAASDSAGSKVLEIVKTASTSIKP